MLATATTEEFVYEAVSAGLFGKIPAGITVNHKNGDKMDNRPSNLDLATPAEQAAHAIHVLRRGSFTTIRGERSSLSKLTNVEAESIRSRYASGEPVTSIAKNFTVSECQVRRVARGQSRRPLAAAACEAES